MERECLGVARVCMDGGGGGGSVPHGAHAPNDCIPSAHIRSRCLHHVVEHGWVGMGGDGWCRADK